MLVLDADALAQIGGDSGVTPECPEAGMCGIEVPGLVDGGVEVAGRKGMNETQEATAAGSVP